MRLTAYLAFMTALFFGLVALIKFLPAAGRPFGFLVGAILFYSIILAIPAAVNRYGK